MFKNLTVVMGLIGVQYRKLEFLELMKVALYVFSCYRDVPVCYIGC